MIAGDTSAQAGQAAQAQLPAPGILGLGGDAVDGSGVGQLRCHPQVVMAAVQQSGIAPPEDSDTAGVVRLAFNGLILAALALVCAEDAAFDTVVADLSPPATDDEREFLEGFTRYVVRNQIEALGDKLQLRPVLQARVERGLAALAQRTSRLDD